MRKSRRSVKTCELTVGKFTRRSSRRLLGYFFCSIGLMASRD